MPTAEQPRPVSSAPPRAPRWPALVGDIGGTHARFAIVESPGALPSHNLVSENAHHESLSSAIEAYLARVKPGRLYSAALAVAGPVDGDTFRFSNIAWDVSLSALASTFGFDRVRLVNDFEALALSIPILTADEFMTIGGGAPVPGAPIAVIGPGTGLGVAGLHIEGEGWRAVPAEGGHSDFAPVTDLEIALLRALRPRFGGQVSHENILCGTGMAALHVALAELEGGDPSPLSPAEIVARATASPPDRLCAETLHRYCEILGSFAGNVALITGARGGVVLGGGILPRMTGFLAASGFRRRFQAKGQMTPYVEAIPTRLILAGDAALRGVATLIGQD